MQRRQLFTQAGTAQILDWSGRTKSRYKALQVAINRPFKGGLLLKGAYTLSKAKNETDDDGWATLTWSQPSQLARNYALAGYDRTHNFQMGFLYEIPFAKNSNNPIGIILKDWQVNGVGSFFSGTPFTIGGDNTQLNQRAGQQTIDLVGPLTTTAIRDLTRRTTRSGRSRSPATSGATRDATSSAAPHSGTWTWACSAAFRSDTTGSSSAPRPPTC